MMETAIAWIHDYEYPALVVLLMLGIVGLPIPDETLLVFVGYLCFKGDLSMPISIVSAVLGSACGITISYGLGQFFGSRVMTTLAPPLHIDEPRFLAAQRWVKRWGTYALCVAYFVPGLRHLGAFAAGASGLRYPTFAVFAYAGALMWVATFITAGYLLGEEWVPFSLALHPTFQWLGIGAALLVISVTVLGPLRRAATKS